MSAKNYDPTQYTIVVAGIPINKGYADGEVIKVERESDAFTDVVGTDGSVTRVAVKDDRATATLSLMQTADANALLSALFLLDRNAPNGAGIGPFLLKDRSGTTILAGDASWIAKPPDASVDKTATPRQWKIRIANLKEFHGGN